MTPNKDTLPKVAFLIISTSGINNRILKISQELTWIRQARKSASVFFTEGNGKLGKGELIVGNLHDLTKLKSGGQSQIPFYELQRFKKNTFVFRSIKGWDQILPNTLSALEKILQLDSFDYIIRTNLSSYWNIDNTLNLLQTLPKSGIYAGPVASKDNFDWVEGDAIIMSCDVAKALLDNRNVINNQVIDDLAIAHSLKYLGYIPFNIPRYRVTLHLKKFSFGINVDNYNSANFFRKCPKKILLAPNIRCKNPLFIFGTSFRLDPLIFLYIRISSMLKFKVS